MSQLESPILTTDFVPHSRTARPGKLAWVLIAVVVLYAAFLLGGPLVAIIGGAFASGVGALWRELTSAAALNALWLTLLLAVAATLINTLFGLCIAWVLARDKFKGQAFINGTVDLPFAVSPVIAGFMLILLFGRNGWFATWLEAANLKIVFALPGMLLATIFVSLPFVVREIVPVLMHLGEEQEHAAYTLGASYWQTFWHITLPNIQWGLLYGVTLTFARALGEFGAVLVVSGSVTRLTETATLFIFRSLDDRNEVGANTMALVLALISFSILLAMEYYKKHARRPV
jgi:sulfate/thiosulfate transport system permease protein